jgi:Xaa-Pro aminopeptidase
MSDRLKKIRKAQEITDLVFSEITELIRPGLTEEALAREIDRRLRKHGSDRRLAFKTLVCSGKRTALFHGPTSGKRIRINEPIYFDFGARYQGWCADMTRTIFFGKPPKSFQKLYALVKIVQEKQIALVKAGAAGADIDQIGRAHV